MSIPITDILALFAFKVQPAALRDWKVSPLFNKERVFMFLHSLARPVLAALVMTVISPVVLYADELDGLPESRFTSIFDGQTMSGWTPNLKVPKAHIGGIWEVKDGMLIGDQDENEGGGLLISPEKYQDFVLRFDLYQDYPTDTGVFVRMADEGKSHQITLDNRPGGQIGSIYLPWTQGRVYENPEGYKLFKQGEWNQVEVRVRGEPSHIQMFLNGKKVTDFQHTEATTKGVPVKGYIALQIHPKTPNIIHWKAGNKIRFKNIRICPLNEEAK